MENANTMDELVAHLKDLAQTIYNSNPDAARVAERSALAIEQCMTDMKNIFAVFMAADRFIKAFYFDNMLPSDIADWDLGSIGDWKHGIATETALMDLAANVLLLCSELEGREKNASRHYN